MKLPSRNYDSCGNDSENRSSDTAGGPRRSRPEDGGTEAECGIQPSGATRSNTAPSNCIDGGSSPTKLLRWGIDSLYLSYRGELPDSRIFELDGLKELAQSDDESTRANARLDIAGHIFEVSDKGSRQFAYVLVDNWFRISICRAKNSALPLAYCQISSELLTSFGVEETERQLRIVVSRLGASQEPALVSRVDLFVDFTTNESIDGSLCRAWVSRAKRRVGYWNGVTFTGWHIGRSGMVARLYDKTLELVESKKDYLRGLWAEKGWNDNEPVWRLEFQYRRTFLLKTVGGDLASLRRKQDDLWSYASSKWLRLAIPKATDSTRCRWPTHPLWISLQSVPWDQSSSNSLIRVPKERAPSDRTLFLNGFAGITSFMARYGIEDIGEGFGEYLAKAEVFHDSEGNKGFRNYIGEKVAEKERRYNTPLPDVVDKSKDG